MRSKALLIGVIVALVAFLPAFAWAETGSRSTGGSSERNKVSTSDELSDRTKRNEEVANAPPPKPRDRSQDSGVAPLPVIPVNPIAPPAAQ